MQARYFVLCCIGMHADRRNAQKGWSCLINPVHKGQLEVVKYLVEVGGKELLMLVDKVCARACICLCSSYHE
jgi:hypothetical protein